MAEVPHAAPAVPRPPRAVGVGWAVSMTGPARWFLVAEVVVAVVWLLVFSDPRASLLWSLLAVVATSVLVVVGAVTAAAGRSRKPYRLSLRRPGRFVVAMMVTAAVTVGLCATRAPMWLRFYQARPQLLQLAQEAEHGGVGHRAVAGTYHLRKVTVGSDRIVYFETTLSGFYEEAGYAYIPAGDPTAAGSRVAVDAVSDGRIYTHLTGPWWIAVNEDPVF